MKLEKMNVSELNRNEMTEINGGGWWGRVFGGIVTALCTIAVAEVCPIAAPVVFALGVGAIGELE